MAFSDWLQEEIDKREWSQSDLARAAGLNRAVINKLLNRKSNPHPATLTAIAHAFKQPVETVFRAAGLLPEIPENEAFTEEINHKLNLIRDPQRRATALRLLQTLIEEEQVQGNRIPGIGDPDGGRRKL